MNLFEKQQKPFAIKLSERVKEEIKKEFWSDRYNKTPNNLYFHYPNFNNFKGFDESNHLGFTEQPNYTLITEAEFFGDGSNKLREKMQMYVDIYKEEHLVDALEQINDDFTDKFFDWANVNAYKYPTTITTAELRQIFKTQYYG